MQPSYQSGFYAPGRGVAKHPELWDGCVGAWNPGLGNTGLSLRDWSGSQNNGTLTNGPTWGVSEGRQALTFDGVNDFVDFSNVGSPIIPATADFSISMWVYLSAVADQRFFSSHLQPSTIPKRNPHPSPTSRHRLRTRTTQNIFHSGGNKHITVLRCTESSHLCRHKLKWHHSTK
jgi:hypothetical protein